MIPFLTISSVSEHADRASFRGSQAGLTGTMMIHDKNAASADSTMMCPLRNVRVLSQLGYKDVSRGDRTQSTHDRLWTQTSPALSQFLPSPGAIREYPSRFPLSTILFDHPGSFPLDLLDHRMRVPGRYSSGVMVLRVEVEQDEHSNGDEA